MYTGDSDVFGSPAADDWLCLLEAFDQPHRSGLVRAAATTMFFGETTETLAAQGDTLTDRIADTLREWADHARERGVAAVFEAAQLSGMGTRVLSWLDGERHMTDLAHLTQVLHDTAHREHFSLPALRDWLRTQREERSGATERNRRLDSDAAAVQIMTVWVSKGLQYPVVYLPFAFNRNIQTRDVVLFHDGDTRCLHIGGEHSPDFDAVQQLGRREAASDDVRLTYVALTRAQSQVVAWWAPSWDEPNGGLSRLLRGRQPGDPVVPDRCDPPKIDDADAMAALRAWENVGGPVLEDSVIAPAADVELPPAPSGLDVRHFHRHIDASWRRTSYSGLIRAAESARGVQRAGGHRARRRGRRRAGPRACRRSGRTCRRRWPTCRRARSSARWCTRCSKPPIRSPPTSRPSWSRRSANTRCGGPSTSRPTSLAAAMVPLNDTPLGPLAPGVTLRQIGLRDRLREMEFEFPLAGGDRAGRRTVDLAGRRRSAAGGAPARR